MLFIIHCDMDILIAAATGFEVEALQQSLTEAALPHTIDFVITDVGMTATTFHLTRHLMTRSYDLAIQAGIAGAFNRSLGIGEVVEVTADAYGDTGTEDGEAFLSVLDMDLLQQDRPLFEASPYLYNSCSYTSLRQVKGITVNTCTGSLPTEERRKQALAPDIETMEGLPFHYVCTHLQQPFVQLRSISNYTGIRDKSGWDIPLAIKNLNTFVQDFLQQPHIPSRYRS